MRKPQPGGHGGCHRLSFRQGLPESRTREGKVAVWLDHGDRFEGYNAIDIANGVDATGCRYDEMIWRARDYLYGRGIDPRIMRLLNTAREFGTGRTPVIYIENHDHSEIAAVASGAGYTDPFRRDRWYRAQPRI